MLQCCAHLGPSRRGAPKEQPPSRPDQGRRDASGRPGPCSLGQFRPFRPPTAQGVWFFVGCRLPARGNFAPRGALMFLAEPGLAAAAAGGGGAAALARAPDAAARRWLPAPCRRARYRACVWRRGAAQRAPRARCAAALRPGACAHPACALGAQPLPGCLVVTVRLGATKSSSGAGIHRHSSPDELFVAY